MNTGKIKSFEIFGLFGTDDVKIPFKDSVKILIGENGLGKTQVLNLFYFTLTKNFFRLSEYHFKKLVLTFSNNNRVEIAKEEVDELVDKVYKHPFIRELIHKLGYSKFETFRNKFLNNPESLDELGFDYLIPDKFIGEKLSSYSIYRAVRKTKELEKKYLVKT